MKAGDWIEGDNGYGVIIRIYPDYYQYLDDDIPEENKIGDKKQDIVILKRLCNFDFKVYPQTRIISASLASKITKKEMEKINKLLKDEKISRKFENYSINDDISEISNWNQNLPKETINKINTSLNKLENNGSLSLTTREIEEYLKSTFNIDLNNTSKFIPNCYIQLESAGLGAYRDKELLFKKISIVEK